MINALIYTMVAVVTLLTFWLPHVPDLPNGVLTVMVTPLSWLLANDDIFASRYLLECLVYGLYIDGALLGWVFIRFAYRKIRGGT